MGLRPAEKYRPSKKPFVIVGLLASVILVIGAAELPGSREAVTERFMLERKSGGADEAAADAGLRQAALRREADGTVRPAGSTERSGGGTVIDTSFQDVDGDDRPELIVVTALEEAAGRLVTEVAAYIWNGQLFDYDQRLTWALSTSRQLFPEP